MSQDPIMLSEVVIRGTNYQYLNATNYTEAIVPVYILEREAARFSVAGRDIFVDEYGTFSVAFHIPEGKVVAVYNEDGKILKTIERYVNPNLPSPVVYALHEQFPDWEIVHDVYHVQYAEDYGAEKFFMVNLKKDGKFMKVKVDKVGTFM